MTRRLFVLSRYVEGVIFSMLLTLKKKLPLSVPEAGSDRSDPSRKRKMLSKLLEHYPYPVTESNHLRTPTENSSDTDTPGKLPYPIPEEN